MLVAQTPGEARRARFFRDFVAALDLPADDLEDVLQNIQHVNISDYLPAESTDAPPPSAPRRHPRSREDDDDDDDDNDDEPDEEEEEQEEDDEEEEEEDDASFCIAQRRRTEFLCSEKEGTARGTRGRFFRCVDPQ